MKQVYGMILGLLLFIGALQLLVMPALAQDNVPVADASEVPTAIVVQSIGSRSGAIELVILFQIVALLVLLSLLMNGTIQDKLRIRWGSKESNSAENRTTTQQSSKSSGQNTLK